MNIFSFNNMNKIIERSCKAAVFSVLLIMSVGVAAPVRADDSGYTDITTYDPTITTYDPAITTYDPTITTYGSSNSFVSGGSNYVTGGGPYYYGGTYGAWPSYGGSYYYGDMYGSGPSYGVDGFNYVSGGGFTYTPSTYTAQATTTWPTTVTSDNAVTGGGFTYTPSTYTAPAATTWPTIEASQNTVTGGGFTYNPYNGNGNYYANNYNGSTNYAAPTCTLTAYQNYINQGGNTTLSWSSNNASYGYIAGVGTVQTNGTVVVSPSQTTGYTATFYGPAGQTNCYATVVVSGTTPAPAGSISLSQVPYTGLDLGPIGTIIYWLTLLIICALVAYALVVKRVQESFLMNVRIVLFGHPEKASHPVYKKAEMNTAKAAPASAAVAPTTAVGGVELPTISASSSEDKTDDFIMSQINRSK